MRISDIRINKQQVESCRLNNQCVFNGISIPEEETDRVVLVRNYQADESAFYVSENGIVSDAATVACNFYEQTFFIDTVVNEIIQIQDVISVGNNLVATWGKAGVIHCYYPMTSGTISIQHQSGKVNKATGTSVKIALNSNGLYLNGEEITVTYFSNFLKNANSGEIYIASVEGKNRSVCFYNEISIINKCCTAEELAEITAV